MNYFSCDSRSHVEAKNGRKNIAIKGVRQEIAILVTCPVGPASQSHLA